MDSEQASLSTIIIDANGNPIGQVIYRCALCRKICDSPSDAMLHYQIDHIEFSKLNQQTSAGTAQTARATNLNLDKTLPTTNRHNNIIHNDQFHQIKSSPINHSQQQQQQNYSKSPSTSTTSSLLKRSSSGSTSSNNSLLKRTSNSSSTTSNSLLRKASNVIRCYQSAGNTTRTTTNRRSTTQQSPLTKNRIETIHRQYTTTSASRAAKRYSTNSSNSSSSNNSRSQPNSNELATPTLKTRNSTPRHVQRTNQYTANLKAKINAQKTATTPSNLASSHKSTPISSQVSNTSNVSNSSESVSLNDSTSTPGGGTQTPSNKDSMKTYSLRPRSERKIARIS